MNAPQAGEVVNPELHPSHYLRHPSGIECWDVVETLPFNVGTAIKHLWRCSLKHESPLQDLQECRNYLAREVARSDPFFEDNPPLTAVIELLLGFYERCEILSDPDDVIECVLDALGGQPVDWVDTLRDALDRVDGMIANVQAGIGLGVTVPG